MPSSSTARWKCHERVPTALPIVPRLHPAILALNNAHAVELSWLNPEQLRSLITQAFYARAVGEVDALLLAFDQTADYDSPNYLWFRERYSRFVYIDRVVVEPLARRRGYAQLLYADLFFCARQAGHSLAVCEVNSNPPNPASDMFHAAQGFAEIGAASTHGGANTVRYLARTIEIG